MSSPTARPLSPFQAQAAPARSLFSLTPSCGLSPPPPTCSIHPLTSAPLVELGPEFELRPDAAQPAQSVLERGEAARDTATALCGRRCGGSEGAPPLGRSSGRGSGEGGRRLRGPRPTRGRARGGRGPCAAADVLAARRGTDSLRIGGGCEEGKGRAVRTNGPSEGKYGSSGESAAGEVRRTDLAVGLPAALVRRLTPDTRVPGRADPGAVEWLL